MGISAATEIFPDEEGNYDSPVLRRLCLTWDEYDAGSIDEEQVLDVLDRVEDLTLSQIEAMEEKPEEPDDPNRLTILKAFHSHLDGVEMMREFFESDDPELVDEALDLVQDATNQMMRGMLGLECDHSAPAPKICLRCSRPNGPQAISCTSCNAILPMLEQPSSTQLFSIVEFVPDTDEMRMVTPNFATMLDAYDAWFDGESDSDTFTKVATSVKARLQKEIDELTRAQSVPRHARLHDYITVRIPVLEQNRDAVLTILDGLARDKVRLVEDGMDLLDQATAAIIDLEQEWSEALAGR